MSENKKLNSVHFLRFIAAFAVLAHHVAQIYNGPIWVGAAGVDVFFVISGLVIGLALMSDDSAGTFVTKRFIRVYPIYWIATIILIAVNHFVNGGAPSWEHVARSALLLPQFGHKWAPIYWAAWTLTYEVLFYCIAGATLLLCRERALLACIVAMAFLATALIPIPFADGAKDFKTSICLEFLFGLLIAIAVRHRLIPSRRNALPLLVFSVAMFAYNYGLANHGPREISWGIPAAILIYSLLAYDDAPLFKTRFVKLGGDSSYALYLTHVTWMTVLYYIAFETGFVLTEHPFIVACVWIPTGLAVGILTHLFIEKPLLNSLRLVFLQRGSEVKVTASSIAGK